MGSLFKVSTVGEVALCATGDPHRRSLIQFLEDQATESITTYPVAFLVCTHLYIWVEKDDVE